MLYGLFFKLEKLNGKEERKRNRRTFRYFACFKAELEAQIHEEA